MTLPPPPAPPTPGHPAARRQACPHRPTGAAGSALHAWPSDMQSCRDSHRAPPRRPVILKIGPQIKSNQILPPTPPPRPNCPPPLQVLTDSRGGVVSGPVVVAPPPPPPPPPAPPPLLPSEITRQSFLQRVRPSHTVLILHSAAKSLFSVLAARNLLILTSFLRVVTEGSGCRVSWNGGYPTRGIEPAAPG